MRHIQSAQNLLWEGKGFKFSFPKQVLVMGILNVTSDSFSGDGLLNSPARAVAQALKMEEEGADMLDIGAESTRPGAREISIKEELRRLLPTLRKVRKGTRLPISIDTQNSETARAALEEGAQIINDVSGLRKDPRLAEVVARSKAGLILMHSRGTPQTMKRLARYGDVVREVIRELKNGIRTAERAGISSKALVIDPGLGFAKQGPQNMKLVRSIERFLEMGYPVCVGISRKSFIGALVGRTPKERDLATTALHSLLIERGVNILRVHNVAAAKQAVLVTREFLKSNSPIPS